MISHALSIVINELNNHLSDTYGPADGYPRAGLGNLAEGIGSGEGMVPRDIINFSLVNIMEDKTIKNLPEHVRVEPTPYESPALFLNFQILVTATHANYNDALLSLFRTIRYFQYRSVFTQDNVAPAAITTNAPTNPLDRLVSFKLIFDLYSPTMEEINHLWGTLGGKQYPFILYMVRMPDFKFAAM